MLDLVSSPSLDIWQVHALPVTVQLQFIQHAESSSVQFPKMSPRSGPFIHSFLSEVLPATDQRSPISGSTPALFTLVSLATHGQPPASTTVKQHPLTNSASRNLNVNRLTQFPLTRYRANPPQILYRDFALSIDLVTPVPQPLIFGAQAKHSDLPAFNH